MRDEPDSDKAQHTALIVDAGATVVTALIGTLIICILIEKTVGFRLDEEQEQIGMDASLHGEHGYGLTNPDGR